jgi:hypothetical protein
MGAGRIRAGDRDLLDGNIVNWLAVTLSKIESALEQAANQAAAHGVPIGADGQPPSACLANPTAESWRASHQGCYAGA